MAAPHEAISFSFVDDKAVLGDGDRCLEFRDAVVTDVSVQMHPEPCMVGEFGYVLPRHQYFEIQVTIRASESSAASVTAAAHAEAVRKLINQHDRPSRKFRPD